MYSVVVKTNSMNDSVISLSAQDCVDRANILEPNSGAAIKKAKRELLKHHFGGVHQSHGSIIWSFKLGLNND